MNTHPDFINRIFNREKCSCTGVRLNRFGNLEPSEQGSVEIEASRVGSAFVFKDCPRYDRSDRESPRLSDEDLCYAESNPKQRGNCPLISEGYI